MLKALNLKVALQKECFLAYTKRQIFGAVLPGCPQPKTEVRLRLYCDECASGNWLYIAILLVPVEDEQLLLQNLLNARCGNPNIITNWAQCHPLCKYHQRNDTHLHWSDLRNSQKDKSDLARRWVRYFFEDITLTRAYIIGIDLAKLDQKYFGNERTEDNIYNRFFRTALLKATKYFFAQYRTIHISEIFHDRCTAKETHFYFNWQPIFRVNEQDDKVAIDKPTITFLCSDHRESGQYHSHFLQYIDLIVNVFRQGIDAQSKDPLKIELSRIAMPLLERLLKKPDNINSRYCYVRRLKMEFFPKHDIKKLIPDSLEYELKKSDCFYTLRPINITDKKQMQFAFLNSEQ